MLWKDLPWKEIEGMNDALIGSSEAEIELPDGRLATLRHWADGDIWITVYRKHYYAGQKHYADHLPQAVHRDLDILEAQCLLNHYLQG